MRRRADEPGSLGQCWDTLLPADRMPAAEDDQRLVETVRGLHAMDETPGPPPELVRRMWANAVREAAQAPAGVPAASNGHHAAARPAADDRRLAGLVTVVMTIAMALAAGFVAGAVAGGIGSRLIMRLAGALTTGSNRGLLTEAGNQVGHVSLAGTMVLVMFAGLTGAVAAVLYAGIRWMLPWSGWRRGLLFGGIVFAIGGADVLERGVNPDYERFGIAGLNVCLFSLLPVLYGLICAPLADAWIGRVQDWQPRRLGWLAVAAAAPFVALFIAIMAANVAGMPWLLVLFLPGAMRLLARWRPRLLERRLPTLSPPWARVVNYGAVAVPCLVGLGQVAIAIGRILG